MSGEINNSDYDLVAGKVKTLEDYIREQRAAFTKGESEYRTWMHRFMNALEAFDQLTKAEFANLGREEAYEEIKEQARKELE